MINRPKSLLSLIIGCLLFISMPLRVFSETAYEQLQNLTEKQTGTILDPGDPSCVGIDCTDVKKESLPSKTVNPTIAGMLIKKNKLERILIENIQRKDKDIQAIDKKIAGATDILYKAQKTGNNVAEEYSRQIINKAQNEKNVYLKQKQKDEQQLRKVKEELKELSAALTNESVPADTRGIVSRSSGDVSLLRTNSGSNAMSLTNSSVPNVGYLVPGDEIQTGNNSMAELQILSGRGKMTMGENSKLRVEEDNGDAEVVRTLEGKFHFLVDKAEKFQADLETDIATIKDVLDDSKDSYERFIKSLKGKVQKKFESKTRGSGGGAIRGTEYVVNENKDGSSEFIVIEGKVEVTEPNGGKSVMVETGQAVLISSDGKLSEVRQVDTAAIPRWWNE